MGADTVEAATIEDRKAQVKQWLEGLFADQQATLTATLFAPDAVVHTAAGPRTPAIYGPMAIGIRAAMSAPHIAVEEVLADGETVVARWTLQGKHTEGPAYGVAPAGVEVRVPGVSFLYFRGGLVREIVDIEATLTLLRQLGVPLPRPVPRPAPAGVHYPMKALNMAMAWAISALPSSPSVSGCVPVVTQS